MRLHPARAVGLLRAPWMPGWSKDPLWRKARAVPSLDLRFADHKSLVDATTGQNLVTFSRASGGTYVDSQGVIRNATTNLLIWSEDLSQWPSPLQAGATLTLNTATAPNGTVTADTLALSVNSYYYGRPAYTQAGSYTFSVYIRAGSPQTVGLRMANSTGSESSFVSCSVTTGWQRFSVTVNFTSNPVDVLTGLDTRTLGGGTGSAATVYLWGAQLEQSSTVGEYIPTTSTINSAPRFDHDPSTGESLGLLVEEQRTNLLLRSEEFDDASWNSGPAFGLLAFGSGSTVNAALAPSGTNTADLIVEDTANSQHAINQVVNTSSGATVTHSCYVKAAGRGFVRLIVYDNANFSNNFYCFFNLEAGVAGTPGASGTGSQSGVSIQSVGNGWYRCSLTGAASGATTYQARINIASAISTSTYTGDGTSGIYLWGAQLEAGDFPTSYIKTEAATATRAADVASIGPGTNFSSWYRQDEGTVFAEGFPNADTGTARALADFNNNTAFNRISLLRSIALKAQMFVNDNDVYQVNVQTTNNAAATYKAAGVFKVNDFAVSTDGSSAATDALGTVPVISQINFGARADGSNPLNGRIKRLTFWPQRLSNATLQSITQ